MRLESVAIVVVERERVIDSHGCEVADVLGLEAEDVWRKLRRSVLVVWGYDRVIQRDAHDAPSFFFRYCSNGRALRPAGQGILFYDKVTIRARPYNASRAGRASGGNARRRGGLQRDLHRIRTGDVCADPGNEVARPKQTVGH